MCCHKKLLFLTIFSTVLILSGCLNQKTPVEKMYELMEQVVIAENVFEEQQEPLVKAELAEKNIYDKIISLGMKQFDQIIVYADEAIKLLEERKELMKLESESIGKSKEIFNKLSPHIEELEDEQLKSEATSLYEIMTERYSLHDDLQQAYTKAILLDGELYKLFKNKNLTLEQIENQINMINETYEEVFRINEEFNRKTEEYNELKLNFYKNAGFKIDYEKDREKR